MRPFDAPCSVCGITIGKAYYVVRLDGSIVHRDGACWLAAVCASAPTPTEEKPA